jgi:protein TonB
MKNVNRFALFASLLFAALCLLPALRAEGTEEKAVPLKTVAPEYPTSLRQKGVAGLVVVKVTVDEKGKPADVAVAKSTNDQLDVYATRAVQRWTFKPAKKDGIATTSTVTIPIQFSLEES